MAVSETSGNQQLTGLAAETYNRLSGIEVVPADKVGFAGMTAEMFIRLLIAELQNQDPLEPVSNEQLVNQLSAIQSLQSNVELSEAIELMTQTLGSPSSGQQLSTASTFIGQSITGANSLTGIEDRAFLQDGEVFVGIGNLGLSLDEIGSINTAKSLVGKLVTGKTDAGKAVIGIVDDTSQDGGVDHVNIDGSAVRMAEVTSVNTAESLVGKTVSVQNSGSSFVGVVEAVIQGSGGPVLVVGDEQFTLSEVTSISVGTTIVP